MPRGAGPDARDDVLRREHQRVMPAADVLRHLRHSVFSLAAIAAAKAKIEARAQQRFAREQAEYEAKMATRAAKSAPMAPPKIVISSVGMASSTVCMEPPEMM